MLPKKNMMQLLLLFLISMTMPMDSLAVCDENTTPWQESRDSHQPTDLTGDADSLMYLAETLADDQLFETQLDSMLFPRPIDSPEKEQVEEYIETTLTDLGWTVERDEVFAATPIGPKHFTNIMAYLHPDRPRRAVIACHYDSVPFIEDFVGATDSAVPCAMLLNLASTMTSNVLQEIASPDLTITLMFFDGEEGMLDTSSYDGIYGSTDLAERWAEQEYLAPAQDYCQVQQATYLDRMDLLFLMDLIGTNESDFQEFIFDDANDNSYYQMMADIETALDEVYPVETNSMFNGLDSTGSVLDDHTPFVDAGLTRVFYVITRPFPDVWHTVEDDRDCLDFDYIKRLNQLLRIWVAQYVQYQGI